MKVPIIGPVVTFVKGLLWAIISSLRQTIIAIATALRLRSLTTLIGLLKEGSPLESLVNNVLSAVFWVLLVAPVVLVPIYYLALSLKP